MPFSGDTFTHLFDWEKDPQRQEKIINARLEAEFDGVDTGLSGIVGGAVAFTALNLASGAVITHANAETLTFASNALTGLGLATVTFNVESAEQQMILAAYSDTASHAGGLRFRHVRGTIAAPTALSSGDRIGSFSFQGQMSTTPNDLATPCSIISVTDEALSSTNRGGSFSFEATPIGSSSRAQQFKVAGGAIYFPGAGTTASAANVFLDSGSTPANQILRSTSSLRYKRDVEPMDMTISARIVDQAEAIFYRSAIPRDRQDWSHYGLAAEQMAAVEPRLVHWGYAEDAYDIGTVDDGDGPREIKTLKAGAELVPDGVAYDRLVVPLLMCVRELRSRVAALELQLASRQ